MEFKRSFYNVEATAYPIFEISLVEDDSETWEGLCTHKNKHEISNFYWKHIWCWP